MGFANPAGTEEGVAKEELTKFISNIEADLRLTVDHIAWFVEDENLQKKIKTAWVKVEEKRRFDIVRSGIEEVTLDKLQERGLTLEELDLKTTLYYKRSEEFNAFLEEERRPGWRKRAWGFFKRLAGPNSEGRPRPSQAQNFPKPLRHQDAGAGLGPAQFRSQNRRGLSAEDERPPVEPIPGGDSCQGLRPQRRGTRA